MKDSLGVQWDSAWMFVAEDVMVLLAPAAHEGLT